jgi:hypothetical protein
MAESVTETKKQNKSKAKAKKVEIDLKGFKKSKSDYSSFNK